MTRAYSLKQVVTGFVVVTILLVIFVQANVVGFVLEKAYRDIQTATEQDISRTVQIAYNQTFVRNSELADLITTLVGIKAAMRDQDAITAAAILHAGFINAFMLNGITEVWVYDANRKYLADEGVTQHKVKRRFLTELAQLAGSEKPVYFIRCTGDPPTCTGYSAIPVMSLGNTVGYIVVGFDTREVFLQYLSSEQTSVSMVSRRTAHPGSGVVYLKLADIALPPNIWIKVVTGSGKQEMIAERLQKTLLIFEIVGGVILMALLLYLISVPVASLKQTSNMIRQLKRGATASFIENANHAVSQIIAIEEVNQIRQDTIELSTVLDQAVTERVLRSIAETRAEEKKSALSKAAHEFELERKQLAQEFHDDLGQRMTAIRYQLAMLQKASTPTSTKEQITAITQSIVKMESSITSILDGLHPPLIDSLGILGAISAVVREMTEANRRKCTYDVVVSEKVGESAVAIQIALFRIVQESINNALKYARPSHIRIRIEYSKTEEHLLEGSIYNDGGGFDQSEVGAGRGLSGMEERVMRLGGQFSIKSSSQEEETTVSFSIPVA